MRINLTLAILILVFIKSSDCQIPYFPYEPIAFENLEPIWYEAIYDEALDGYYSDGYNYFSDWLVKEVDPVENGKFIYSTLSFRGWDDTNEGTYFEKRNTSTGEIIWITKYDIESNLRQEVPKTIYLNEDDDLVVLGMKRVSPYNERDPGLMQEYGSFNMRFTKRIYDNNDGSLIYHYDPDLSDIDLAVMKTIDEDDGWGSRTIIDDRDPNHYRYIEAINEKDSSEYGTINNLNIIAYDIDSLGRIVGNIDSIFFYKESEYLKFSPYGESGFIFIDNNSSGKLTFYFLDKNLNIDSKIDSVMIDYTFGPVFLEIADQSKILIKYFNDFNGSTLTPIFTYALYDENGGLLNQAGLDYDTKYSDFGIPLILDTSDDIYLVASNYITELTNDPTYFTSLDVLKSNLDKGFDLVKRHKFKGGRMFVPSRLNILEDGNILFHNAEKFYNLQGNGSVNYHERSTARSLMSIKAEDLGIDLVSSTNERLNALSEKVKIWPNPVVSNLYLEFEQAFTGTVNIFDLQGNKLKTTTIYNSDFLKIELAHLKPGIYMVDFTSLEGHQFINQEKFIKL